MEERYFKISEPHLVSVLNYLKKAPYEHVHAAMLVLEQLPVIDESESTTGDEKSGLIEG